MTGHAAKVLDPTFMDHAACRGMDQDLFLPEKGNAPALYATARKVCRTCPVRLACLRYALDAGEKHGMWGGFTPKERRFMRSDRRPFALSAALARADQEAARS